MVWQFEVPGAHRVTLTKGVLTVWIGPAEAFAGSVGPASAMTDTTLPGVGGGFPPEPPEPWEPEPPTVEPPLPPPPQPPASTIAQVASAATSAEHPLRLTVMGCSAEAGRWTRPAARVAARRRFRGTHADVRRGAPQGRAAGRRRACARVGRHEAPTGISESMRRVSVAGPAGTDRATSRQTRCRRCWRT